MDRRSFLRSAFWIGSGAWLVGPSALWSCQSPFSIPGELTMPNYKLGHQLQKKKDNPRDCQKLSTKVLIIGGGASGLSARRWLRQAGYADVLLVELESVCGGNARGGRLEEMPHPLGAHYLPIPDSDNKELIRFLEEAGSIIGRNQENLPIYNPYHLCHDPMERLFLEGKWINGLIPNYGLREETQIQFGKFFALTASLKQRKGVDGRYLFQFPLSEASKDPFMTELDQQSFSDWLLSNGFDDPDLLHYLRYCCKDDYGADLPQVSAFAGLHYHAARRGAGDQVASDDVLVWPEGNQFLINALLKDQEGVKTGFLVTSLTLTDQGVSAQAVSESECLTIEAEKVIMAVPDAVACKILAEAIPERQPLKLTHSPWVITQLLTEKLPEKGAVPLCWDNVIHGSQSVGYVNAAHQQLNRIPQKRILTHYWPIVNLPQKESRKMLQSLNREDWLAQVFEELKPIYPDLAQYTKQAHIWIWGHGMVAPTIGLLSSGVLQQASTPIQNRIFFAHTDYSGISVFEEAFDQGIKAAQAILQNG